MSEEQVWLEKTLALRERLERELKIGPGSAIELDSMEMFSLLQAVEEVVGVELSFAEAGRCKTFEQLEDLIRERM
jgi:acyl carrier protein